MWYIGSSTCCLEVERVLDLGPIILEPRAHTAQWNFKAGQTYLLSLLLPHESSKYHLHSVIVVENGTAIPYTLPESWPLAWYMNAAISYRKMAQPFQIIFIVNNLKHLLNCHLWKCAPKTRNFITYRFYSRISHIFLCSKFKEKVRVQPYTWGASACRAFRLCITETYSTPS